MLSVLTTKEKEHKDAFGGDGYDYYLDCGDGFKCIRIYPNSSNCIH